MGVAFKVVRSSDVPWSDAIDRGPFQGRRKALGGERLTAGLWELPPGKRSFPLHMHHVTEEAMWVVSGTCHVRTPNGETQLHAGDYVSFPAGGPAHQLVNHSDAPCIYVGLSATQGPDIVEYPDSGKVAASVGVAGGGRKRWIFRDQVDYFDGEG